MIRYVVGENLPRVLQLQTACIVTPVRLAVPELPLSASMIASIDVSSVMRANLHDPFNPSSGHGALIDGPVTGRKNAFMVVPPHSPTHPKAVGARITEFRGARTLTEFAKEAKISVQALKNYESGLRRPNIEQAYKLWLNTGLRTDFLYHGYAARAPEHEVVPAPGFTRRVK